MVKKSEQRVSYSVLSDLQKCSYKLYLSKMEGIPSAPHPKTVMGSLSHSILECLVKKKHFKHYETIVKDNTVDYTRSKVIDRQVRYWKWKYNLPNFLIEDLNEMLRVAILETDFFFKDAIKVFEPEHEFIVEVDGAKLKGIIDRMAEYPDHFIVRDYKSSASKFDKDELLNGFQAHIYQWYIRKMYNKPAIVEFVFLRHGPTKRTPEKHIQRVQPITSEQEQGFEFYAKYIYGVLNSFGVKDAYENFCKDFGFCRNVCPYFKPFDYIIVREKETNREIKKYLVDARYELKDNEYSETVRFPGCVKFNKISN